MMKRSMVASAVLFVATLAAGPSLAVSNGEYCNYEQKRCFRSVVQGSEDALRQQRQCMRTTERCYHTGVWRSDDREE